MSSQSHQRHIVSVGVWAFILLAIPGIASTDSLGFNVNSEVTFIPITSSIRTVTSTTGCPPGFAGKFTFTATLTNKPVSSAMPGISVRVLTLTNGNVLLDVQTDSVLGGPGAVVQAPKTGQYADGLLGPGESVEVPFAICLKTLQPFQFFVDVFGIVTKLVSINRLGTDSGNAGSATSLAMTPDGRFVAFESQATDLTSMNLTAGISNIFVRDVQTGVTVLASVNRFGTSGGNDYSLDPAISADGRFVVFRSNATDLVPNDNNGVNDVFVRDLQTGTTRLVSVNRFETGSANNSSDTAAINADGRFIAFRSRASDLVPSDTNGIADVFVRDMVNGTTRLVSVDRTGQGSNLFECHDFHGLPEPCTVGEIQINANGRYVAFGSDRDDLVTNDHNTTFRFNHDLFVSDLQLGTTTLVTVNRFGTNSSGGFGATFSADFRYAAFISDANDIVENVNGGVFVRDLQLGTTTLVSVNRSGTGSANGISRAAAISGNGRFVAFQNEGGDLVPNGISSDPNIFVRDLISGTTTLVSVNHAGTTFGNSGSLGPTISDDGRFVAFASGASDLTEDVRGPLWSGDVFVRNLQKGVTSLVTVNRMGEPDVGGAGGDGAISRNGRFVLFRTATANLVPNDTNGLLDVFIRPVP
jgi:hypothetical protein